MAELERAKQEVYLAEQAIASVKFAAKETRRITHSKHPDQCYVDALNNLDLKLTRASSYLTRIEAIGR